MTKLQPHTPVRDIGISSRGVTGSVPWLGKYESTLERDLMEILRFDTKVELFTPQPLTIEYLDSENNVRRYTPDGLIKFHSSPDFHAMPILFEVKYRADFRHDWKVLMPKFRAAKAYCRDQMWRFEVFTEREIRTPYLSNVKFLWPYRDRLPSPQMKQLVLQTLWDLDESDPELLLCALCHDRTNRANMIPVIWHLIAVGAVGCNLDTPLTMRSPIWAEEDC